MITSLFTATITSTGQLSAEKPGPDAVIAAWDAEFGRPGALFAGVHLGARRDLPHHTVAYPVIGEPIDLATLRAAQPVIAALLNRPVHTVVIVQTGVDELELRLLDDALLRQPLPHPGPAALDTDTGVVVLGVHADAAPATWRLWTTARAYHGVVVGGTEPEQGEVLRGLAAATTGQEAVVCWQIDPYGNLGLTGADRTATDLYEAVSLVADLAALVERRTRVLTAQGRRWQPTREMPLVLVTVAAAGRVLEHADDTGRSIAEILAGALRRAGHVGVSLVLAVDNARLDTFGGFCGLRSSVTQPNLLLLRSHTTAAAPLSADVPDTTILPRSAGGQLLPGLGYRLGSPVPLRLFTATTAADAPEDGAQVVAAGPPRWLNPGAWVVAAALGTELVDAVLDVPRATLMGHAIIAAVVALLACYGLRILHSPDRGSPTGAGDHEGSQDTAATSTTRPAPARQPAGTP